MVLFNNIPYKHMRLTSKVILTKRFSEKYKRIRLTTRLYGSLLRVADIQSVLLLCNNT